jgi:O-antigen/teichoic acid export membrane protein
VSRKPEPAPEPDEFLSQAPVEGGLKRATVQATAWTGASTVSQQVIQLGITVILARLLLPREYGLVAMIAVFTGFARLFIDSGFGAAVIQRKELSAAHLSTAFWANLAVGAAISGLAAAFAPLVAHFYGQPQLEVLMPVAGLDFVIVSLKIVQVALVERRLLYRRLALIDNVALAAAGTVAISCAFAGLGVWSLIVFTFVFDGADTLLLWLLTDWRPSRVFDRAALRELWGFGGNVLGSNALNYWFRNLDNLLIGRFAGAASLGLYNRAYNLVLLQLTSISYVAGRPLFPALSKLQEQPERLRRAYLRALGVVAFVTFPLATGFFVIAGPLVLTLFGARWTSAIPLVRILAVAAVAQAISTTAGVVYLARGRTDWLLRWQLFSSVAAAVAFGIGVHWGAKGVAISVSVLNAALLYPCFAIPGRLIGMRFLDVVRAVGGVFVAAVGSAAAAWGAGRAVVAHSPELELLLQVAVGAVTYVGAAHVARLSPYRELREILRSRSSARSHAPALAPDV